FFDRMYIEHSDSPFFFYLSFLFFYVNGFIISKFCEVCFNFKRSTIEIDLLVKFTKLLLTSFKNFGLYLFIKSKKLLFSFLRKFAKKLTTTYDFIKYYLDFIPFKWRPVFKKTSYFGFFRTFRNK